MKKTTEKQILEAQMRCLKSKIAAEERLLKDLAKVTKKST